MGSGTLGKEASDFLRFLKEAGQSFWQVLPVGPVCGHLGNSPYASPSAFAGNTHFISLEKLSAELDFAADLRQNPFAAGSDFIDFERLSAFRQPQLEKAADRFRRRAAREQEDFRGFCATQRTWLDDYSLYAALARHIGSHDWLSWEEGLSGRRSDTLAHWQRILAKEIETEKFLQYTFFRQWRELKEVARREGIRLIGDIPFYVNFESADAWAHPEIFDLHPQTHRPLAVAGVPPDYFSAAGQRWGNPLYRWRDSEGKLFEPTLEWWTRRIGHLLELVDMVRIDHFRGFEAYWAVPADEATAVNGRWRPGPGREFFDRLRERLGKLPLIAEDLGFITPEVETLRTELGLPGMKILQFAFSGRPDNPYLPHNFRDSNSVVYTGTHDNNTANGWFYGTETAEATKAFVQEYLGVGHRQQFHWQLIRLALSSIADLAIIPVQDVLGYGGEFRMNTPASAQGNWRWKLTPGALTADVGDRLRGLCRLFNRLPAETAR